MEGGRFEKAKKLSFALHAEISAEVVIKWRRKRRILTVDLEQLNFRLPPCMSVCFFVPSTRIFRRSESSLHGARIFPSLRQKVATKILALGPSTLNVLHVN